MTALRWLPYLMMTKHNLLGRDYLLRPRKPTRDSARFVIIGQELVWHGYLLDRLTRAWGCTLDQTVIIPHFKDHYAYISSTHHILKSTVQERSQVF